MVLQIDPQIVRDIHAITHPDQLHDYLQQAVKLEHATIPPYLTAMFTLKAGVNDDIAALIRAIVVEEMLHMTIAANVLIAIGGAPSINGADFVPSYPGPLPMGIGGGSFDVPIAAFSIDLVKDKFMIIEEPVSKVPMADALGEFETIGAFYTAIQDKITELGDSIFTVGPDRQVLTGFDPSKQFAITSAETAKAAIEIIKVEGEGTSSDPFEGQNDPAHYYKFGEIAAGKKIIALAGGKYAYEGEPVPFDASGVVPMPPNVHIGTFPEGSAAYVAVVRYASMYSKLLNSLHETFNGAPSNIDAAIGLMYGLKLQASKTLATSDGSGGLAGLCYEYVQPQHLFAVGIAD